MEPPAGSSAIERSSALAGDAARPECQVARKGAGPRDTAWAMSEKENVELARRAYEAFRRRDRTTWLARHDVDFELEPTPDWPEPTVRGREAGWDFYVNMFDAFERAPIEPGDFQLADAGNDKVLIHHRADVRGRGERRRCRGRLLARRDRPARKVPTRRVVRGPRHSLRSRRAAGVTLCPKDRSSPGSQRSGWFASPSGRLE
jgi:ketosteroid isomerase-like protein